MAAWVASHAAAPSSPEGGTEGSNPPPSSGESVSGGTLSSWARTPAFRAGFWAAFPAQSAEADWPRRGDRSAAAPLGARQGQRRPNRADLGRSRPRQVAHHRGIGGAAPRPRRDSLYPETVTIDLDAAKRVEQSLMAGGLIKSGAR